MAKPALNGIQFEHFPKTSNAIGRMWDMVGRGVPGMGIAFSLKETTVCLPIALLSVELCAIHGALTERMTLTGAEWL